MKKVSLVVYVIIFVLFGVSNAYSSDNQSSAQTAQSVAPEERQSVMSEGNEPGTPPNAANMGYEKTAINKIGRGVFNMATFYLEIPASAIRLTKEKDNVLYGGTVGVFQGLFTALGRVLTGAYDTVTFVIPPYNKPLMEPEYTLDSWEEALDE